VKNFAVSPANATLNVCILRTEQQMTDRRKEDRAWNTWAMMRVRLQNGAWVYVVFAGLLFLVSLM
jgi:hypothetical protein